MKEGNPDWAIAEYEQLCEIWRQRDRYVMEKVSHLFLLTSITIGSAWLVPRDSYSPLEVTAIRALLFFWGAMMSFVLNVSITRDTYYRDGTEEVIVSLLREAKGDLRNSAVAEIYDAALQSESFPQKLRMNSDDWLGTAAGRPGRLGPRRIDKWIAALFIPHYTYTQIRRIAFLTFCLMFFLLGAHIGQILRLMLS